jgi:hypothetical protein
MKEGAMLWLKRLWCNAALRNSLAAVVAVAGVAGTSPATSIALAASAGPREQPNAMSAQAVGARLQAAIKLLDPYVVNNSDGTLALSAPAAVARHVNTGDMITLRDGLATVNAKIKAGELATAAGHRVFDPKATVFNIQWNWTFRSYHWWGEQDWFSEYWTLKIEAAYGMGAAAAGICAVVAGAFGIAPVALLCGIAAGVLAFGAAWVMWADNGGGVVFSQTWTPFPIGGIWISGQ